MNRYSFLDNNDGDIKVGMKFVNSTGHVAVVKGKVTGNKWLCEFTDPFTGKVTRNEIPKKIMLISIEQSKDPKSKVRLTYA